MGLLRGRPRQAARKPVFLSSMPNRRRDSFRCRQGEFRTRNEHQFARKENGRDGERLLGTVSDSNGPPCKLDRNFAAIQFSRKKKKGLQDFPVFPQPVVVVVGAVVFERQRKLNLNPKRLRLAKDN